MYLIQELHLEAYGYWEAENSKAITITVAFYRSPSVLTKSSRNGFLLFFWGGFWQFLVCVWSFWWEVLLFSLQFMALSGHAAMETAVQGSQWNSSCSRSSIVTRPNRSLGHTTVSALVPWVSTMGGHQIDHSSVQTWGRVCVTEVLKCCIMKCWETVNSEVTEEVLSIKRCSWNFWKKSQCFVMCSNKCCLYVTCSKRYILLDMLKFCYQSLKIWYSSSFTLWTPCPAAHFAEENGLRWQITRYRWDKIGFI